MPTVIDLNSFTLDELDEVEQLGELSLSEVFAGRVTSKMLRALVFIVRRRDDPNFTLADAGKVRMPEVQIERDDLPPDNAADSEK